MQYLLEDVGPVTVLRFRGDLAGSDDAELEALFVGLRHDGKTRVVADMSQVGFMDSTVIGLLVWGMKNLREVDGDLRLCRLTTALDQLFEITNLDRAFQIYEAESSALASFA